MMKLRKMVVMGIVSVLAVSASSISAFAKKEINLENGIKIIMYEDGDVIPALPQSRAVIPPFSFNGTFPRYSSYRFLTDTVTGSDEIMLRPLHDSIRIEFDSVPDSFYINIYNHYYDRFDTSGTNGLMFLQNPTTVFDIEGIQNGGNYSVGFAGTSSSINLSGSIQTYDWYPNLG